MARRITLGELPAPFKVTPVKIDRIMQYGDDNAYPTRMERIINASITANSASKMLSRFIIGKGFKNPDLNKIVVGTDEYYREVTAYKLLSQIAYSIARFNGFYARVQYNANYKVTGIRHEPFKYCRFGMADDNDFSGKVVIYNNWDKYRTSKKEVEKFKVVDVFNPRENVIEAQIGDKPFARYKGQVYFNFLDDEYIYPASPIDPVLWDADTESQIGIFKNGEVRRGFFLKYVVHHTEFENEKEAQDFADKMRNMMGGDHEISVMVCEGKFDPKTGALIKEENFHIEKVEQNINDKIFESYEKSTLNNIRKAFDAIPQILIDYEDSKLGTTSGEALKQAATFYNSQTVNKRQVVSNSFKEIFSYWVDSKYQNETFEIEPLNFEPVTQVI